MCDYKDIKKILMKNGFSFNEYINAHGERAIAFESVGQTSIGYISHGMHFGKEGQLCYLSNWDYDHGHDGYELI